MKRQLREGRSGLNLKSLDKGSYSGIFLVLAQNKTEIQKNIEKCNMMISKGKKKLEQSVEKPQYQLCRGEKMRNLVSMM